MNIALALHTMPKCSRPAGGPVLACIVGEALDLTTVAGLIATAAQTTTLARRPSGSSSTVASHAVTPDLPGEYDVTVEAVALKRTIRIVAFPSSFLTTKVPSMGASRLLTLDQLARWANACALADITTALEGAGATPAFGNLWAAPKAAVTELS